MSWKDDSNRSMSTYWTGGWLRDDSMALDQFDVETIICGYFGNTLVAYNCVQID